MAAQQYFTARYEFANPLNFDDGSSRTQRQILTSMIEDAIKQYRANRGKVPKKVIILVRSFFLSRLAPFSRLANDRNSVICRSSCSAAACRRASRSW